MRKFDQDLHAQNPAQKALPRRHFLRGAGGFLLSIPFLDSLLPSSTRAQTRTTKRFVAMLTGHGGAWGADMHPAASTYNQSMSYAGHTIRRGALSLSVASGRASVSRILSASSSALTPRLAAKMNVLRGFGVPFYGAHHIGGHLGNWATTDGNPHNLQNRRTIDNVIAYAPGFYDTAPLARVMVCGVDHPSVARSSWSYENPTLKSGPVVTSSPAGDSRRLFDRIYSPTQTTTSSPRRPVVDRVLEDYRRLRNNARLSARDRQRLDAHIAHLNDLDQKLSRPQVSCGQTAPVENNDSLRFLAHDEDHQLAAERLQLWCDVVALAFACDTSRIAVLPIHSSFSDWTGTGPRDFHQAIAHQCGRLLSDTLEVPVEAPHPRFRIAETYQRMFEHGFLYLANRLDALADGDGSLLDSCLLSWSHEAGLQTHDQIDLPAVTMGSAGGAIRTGFAADYRNLTYVTREDRELPEPRYPGLFWHQYLGSILQAMGVPESEYRSGPYGGYGDDFQEDSYRNSNIYPSAVWQARGDMLPFFT